MTAPVWSGKHMWVWTISATMNGDVNRIIAKLKEIGARGVIVKAHDAGNIWPQFRNTLQAFKNAGFLVGAWGYVYGNDVQAEFNAANDAITAGADWYVIDAEAEYEGKQAQATQFGQLLRQAHPDFPIGYAPFPFPQYHKSYPYAEFSKFCNVVLPQVYWGELVPTVDVCLQQSFASLKQYGLPVAPIGQAFVTPYVPTDDDYQKFESVSKQLGATGVSFWSMQHATDKMFASIKDMNFPIPVDAPAPALNTASGSIKVAPAPAIDNISSWAKESVDKIIKVGLMKGYDDGLFHGHDAVTREQLAVILDKAGILDEILKTKELK
jgi:hypothetical protein